MRAILVQNTVWAKGTCRTRLGSILETGRIVMDGPAKSLRENEDVKEFYLGIAEGSKKSFREVKSYKRRKRWLA